MRIDIICVAARRPAWEDEGVRNYLGRLPQHLKAQLVTLAPDKRRGNSDAQRRESEGKRILERIPDRSIVVALDESGRQWSSKELSVKLESWQQLGQPLVFAIGGADGHADGVRQRADHLWSLSSLTFPHGIVRVLLAEQLYRAHSLLAGHPYHRE